MHYQPEVRKDLLKVFILMLIFVGSLIALKLYDTKTNEVGKIGHKLLKTYVR